MMAVEHESIPRILEGCLKAALQTPDLARACRQRLEGIAGDIAVGLVALFQGPWELTAPQVAEMSIWPVPQLALVRSAAIAAAQWVEATGQPISCQCTGVAGNLRSLSVTFSDSGSLSVEFVGPNLV